MDTPSYKGSLPNYEIEVSIFTVSEHVARSLVMLRKNYCPESLVILIRC